MLDLAAQIFSDYWLFTALPVAAVLMHWNAEREAQEMRERWGRRGFSVAPTPLERKRPSE